jgi:hypothetical protein
MPYLVLHRRNVIIWTLSRFLRRLGPKTQSRIDQCRSYSELRKELQCPRKIAPDSAYRPGVGIMLLDNWWLALVAHRVGGSGEAWQMPQGEIRDGETPLQAAYRELKEEIGVEATELIAERGVVAV